MRSILLVVLLSAATPSYSHDWYTGLQNEAGQYCCGGSDCAAVPDRYVTPIPGGYRVDIPDFKGQSVHALVPNARARPAKEGGEYHICVVGHEVRCFFFPAPSY